MADIIADRVELLRLFQSKARCRKTQGAAFRAMSSLEALGLLNDDEHLRLDVAWDHCQTGEGLAELDQVVAELVHGPGGSGRKDMTVVKEVTRFVAEVDGSEHETLLAAQEHASRVEALADWVTEQGWVEYSLTPKWEDGRVQARRGATYNQVVGQRRRHHSRPAVRVHAGAAVQLPAQGGGR